jgi:hypothetical protein
LARYQGAATYLAGLNDQELGQRLGQAQITASGIGGSGAVVDFEGTPVFVKQIPLTDLERRPENIRSTANLFHLPTFYHYGVGSTGFGAWQELAAHQVTTGWVVAGECRSFPLLYHWRVLTGLPVGAAVFQEFADVDDAVAYWDGSWAVRDRLQALAQSSASVALFLEYVPHNLREWLTSRALDGPVATESAIAMVERHLRSDIAFMAARGFLHFDAHFKNILTDGERLYFADLGLATSTQFDLSAPEIEFAGLNASHDACYTVTQLVNWLVTALLALTGVEDRNQFIRECAEGRDPGDVGATAAAVIRRYAPIAVVMNHFYWKLHGENRTTPYPVEELERVAATSGERLRPEWPAIPK